jgi:hypothetical protein
MIAMASDGDVNPEAHSAKETAIMHYVTPRKLLAAEQRSEHQKLDRLVNAGAAQDIVNHFRFFINKHYEVLRRKQTEVKYLAEHAPITVNSGNIVANQLPPMQTPLNYVSPLHADMDIPDELYKDDNMLGLHNHHPVPDKKESSKQFFAKWDYNKEISGITKE